MKWLDEHPEAKETFQELLEQLPDLDQSYYHALSMGAWYLSEWRRVISMKTRLTTEDRGAQRLHPLLRYADTCFQNWLKVAKEFGLTPNAERAISQPPTKRKGTLKRVLLRKEVEKPEKRVSLRF
jgi:phage terminase small subunit